MKKILCCILVISMLSVFAGCMRKDPDSNSNETQETSIIIGAYEESIYEIQTDYCVLKYPVQWKEKAEFTVTDNIVTLTEKSTGIRVFDIVFGEGDGYTLGTLKTDSGDISVKFVSYDFDESLLVYDTLCAMSDDINVIINRLSTEYDFVMA